MAKESVKARQKKREKMVAKYAEKRKALKEDRDYRCLDLIPKNASPVRLKKRYQIICRQRGYFRHFGLSRNIFRDMALQGKIPGVKKASW
jgi:small subunit ribosomal protein S14